MKTFYDALGWDRQTKLNPMKIKVSKADHVLLSSELKNTGEIMTYVNIGPSCD